MRHGQETRMHDLVVHGEHEHMREELEQSDLQILSRLAIDVTFAAPFGSVQLRLETRRTEDTHTIRL